MTSLSLFWSFNLINFIQIQTNPYNSLTCFRKQSLHSTSELTSPLTSSQ